MTYRFRWVLWPVLVIGLALVVVPFAVSMPSKASAGQELLDNFHAIMQPNSVKTTLAYEKVFERLRPMAEGGVAASGEVPALFTSLAAALHMTQPQLASYLSANFPTMAKLLATFPSLTPVFRKVPPGLDWYAPIVSTLRANVANYSKADSLPNLNALTWAFVVPGGLLVLLAGLGIAGAYRPRRPKAQGAPVATEHERAA